MSNVIKNYLAAEERMLLFSIVFLCRDNTDADYRRDRSYKFNLNSYKNKLAVGLLICNLVKRSYYHSSA